MCVLRPDGVVNPASNLITLISIMIKLTQKIAILKYNLKVNKISSVKKKINYLVIIAQASK
jgi:hypothetical protein